MPCLKRTPMVSMTRREEEADVAGWKELACPGRRNTSWLIFLLHAQLTGLVFESPVDPTKPETYI